MSSEDDLVAAIKETLEIDGTLDKLKAEMRTQVMKVLNADGQADRPEQPKETLLINELIREYLTWSGYKYTKSIFVQECGLTNEPLPRSQILQQLGVTDTEDSTKLAVLYGLISAFRNDVKRDT